MNKTPTEAERERKARKELKKQGYLLDKRINIIDLLHNGCYRIINAQTGNCETDPNYTMTIDDVENFIKE